MNKNRKALVMLHGAIGSSRQLISLEDELTPYFEIFNFDLPGHGQRSLEDGEFNISAFAEDVAARLLSLNISGAIFFGYSMGGYVAMYLARKYPDLADGVITLATKFHWDEEGATKESQMLQTDTIAERFPAFAAELQERHQPGDWKNILNKTRQMMLDLGKVNTLQLENYSDIMKPCLVMLGDKDKMVSVEETIAVFKKLPGCRLAILPGTPHPFEKVNSELLIFHIKYFADSIS